MHVVAFSAEVGIPDPYWSNTVRSGLNPRGTPRNHGIQNGKLAPDYSGDPELLYSSVRVIAEVSALVVNWVHVEPLH